MNKIHLKSALELLLNTTQDYVFFKDLNNKETFNKMKNNSIGIMEYKNNISYEVELYEFNEGFFSNLGHELRTPLNILLTSIQLIEYKLKSNGSEEFARIFQNEITNIKLNSFRLLKLSNNFLDLAEFQLGNITLNPDKHNIVEFVESLCDEVNNYLKEYLSSKKLKIIFDTEKEEIILSFDKVMVDRILLNLISNAIKFNENHSDIYVSIALEEKYVILSVKDFGAGISLRHIKSNFYGPINRKNQMTKQAEGCGIGLKITKYLVEIHHGTIDIYNMLGKGTEVRVRLPVFENDNEISAEMTNKILYNRLDRIKMELSDIYNI